MEEAICFGWVDSIVRRIDEATYAQKFTPRKSGSTWSESNIERARRMMKEGKMTPAGREKLENRLPAPTEQLTADN